MNDNNEQYEKVGEYFVTKSVTFSNNRGIAFGENPNAPSPCATWQFVTEGLGKRDYYWGHYMLLKENALKEYAERIDEYQDGYEVSIVDSYDAGEIDWDSLGMSKKYQPSYTVITHIDAASNALAASVEEKGDADLNNYDLNCECGKAIDQAVTDNYTPGQMAGTGYYNNEAAAKEVIGKYGVDRVTMVLASNINAREHDGRISNTNKEWAKSVDAPEKPVFYLNTHSSILDYFADKFREIYQSLQQEMQEKATSHERKPFVLPVKTDTTENVENYLTSKMSFDKGIVKSCIENGSIYQTEVFSQKLGKDTPCAVFAGFDKDGKPQSAIIKGFGSYEKITEGSQLKYPFILAAKETKDKPAITVSVFENPTEALAGATLAKMRDKSTYSAIHRLSASHISTLKSFLENNPQVRMVNLCLPNTNEGRKLYQKMQGMLENLGEQRGETIKLNDLTPKENNYQEQLQNKVSEIKERRKSRETDRS